MTTFEVPCIPVPKARPRVTKSGHTFTPLSTVKAEEDIAWMAKDAGVVLEKGKRYSVSMVFYVKSLRADLDNLEKLVLDGLQRGYPEWNDSQVDEITASKLKVGAGFKTVVTVREL